MISESCYHLGITGIRHDPGYYCTLVISSWLVWPAGTCPPRMVMLPECQRCRCEEQLGNELVLMLLAAPRRLALKLCTCSTHQLSASCHILRCMPAARNCGLPSTLSSLHHPLFQHGKFHEAMFAVDPALIPL